MATDVVELHPEVVWAAREFFGAPVPAALGPAAAAAAGSGATAWARLERLTLAEDALAAVPRLPDGRYGYIIHDCFSGGGVAAPLMSRAFFQLLSSKLKPAGVAAAGASGDGERATAQPAGILAVNYFGLAGEALQLTACRLSGIFRKVRVFKDLEEESAANGKSPSNYVMFASDSDLSRVDVAAAAAAVQGRAGQGGRAESGRRMVLERLAQLEVHLPAGPQRCQQLLRQAEGSQHAWSVRGQWARAQAAVSSWRQQHAVAIDHWLAMRHQVPDSVWLEY